MKLPVALKFTSLACQYFVFIKQGQGSDQHEKVVENKKVSPQTPSSLSRFFWTGEQTLLRVVFSHLKLRQTHFDFNIAV